jgi:hypothetical protein
MKFTREPELSILSREERKKERKEERLKERKQERGTVFFSS